MTVFIHSCFLKNESLNLSQQFYLSSRIQTVAEWAVTVIINNKLLVLGQSSACLLLFGRHPAPKLRREFTMYNVNDNVNLKLDTFVSFSAED